MLFHMIQMEDGQNDVTARGEYEALRHGGGCRTNNIDPWIFPWKFHVFELSACVVNEGVELNWKPADYAGRDLQYDKHFAVNSGYRIMRDGKQIDYILNRADRDVDNNYVDHRYGDDRGKEYVYQIRPMWGMQDFKTNSNMDDRSNKVTAVPVYGSGNALRLGFDGIPQNVVIADTIANDLAFYDDDPEFSPAPAHSHAYFTTLEAWVYPMADKWDSHIFFFERTGSKNEGVHLMYCASEQQFCFRRDDWLSGAAFIGYSPEIFPPNHWYHVAVTLESIQLTQPPVAVLYVNGEEQDLFKLPGEITPARDSSLRIGGGLRGGGGRFFKGMIDEARVWNTVRTQIMKLPVI